MGRLATWPSRTLTTWDRTRARCRDSSWPVSLARPPHRTCPFPGIRRSTSPPGAVVSPLLGPWGGDRRAPVAVARGAHRAGVEQRGLSVGGPPAAAAVAAAEFLPVHLAVFAADPGDDPLPGVGAQVLERRERHAGPEVGGPAPQHPVELVQQGSQRQVGVLAADRLDLGHDGLNGLAGRVGVDVVLPRAPLAV